MTFEQIIEQCINNDRRAQKELFYRYAPLCMSVAQRYLGSSAQASDIVQESMIRIFHHLSQLEVREEHTFKAWMARITSREAIRWRKKQGRFIFQEELSPDHFAPTLPQDVTFQREELQKMLMQLPEGYRMVFNLYVIEEYSHKEIAELLEITPSASRSQLSRARAKLQALMAQKKVYEKVS